MSDTLPLHRISNTRHLDVKESLKRSTCIFGQMGMAWDTSSVGSNPGQQGAFKNPGSCAVGVCRKSEEARSEL